MKDEQFYSHAHYPRVAAGQIWWRKIIARKIAQRAMEAGNIRSGSRVLEAGCDEGQVTRLLMAAGADAYGIDVNADSVRVAGHPHIIVGRADAMPHPDAAFDAVISSHMIEHLERPRDFLAEAARVVKPGGKIVIIYPWELFAGMTVIPDVMMSFQVPTLARIRRIHRHVLNPGKLRTLSEGLPLTHEHSELFLSLPRWLPQHLTVFSRNA